MLQIVKSKRKAKPRTGLPRGATARRASHKRPDQTQTRSGPPPTVAARRAGVGVPRPRAGRERVGEEPASRKAPGEGLGGKARAQRRGERSSGPASAATRAGDTHRPAPGLALPARDRLLTSLTSCRHSSTARLLLQVCLGHTRVTSSLQNSSSASFQPPPAPPGPAPPRRAGGPPAGKGGCGG